MSNIGIRGRSGQTHGTNVWRGAGGTSTPGTGQKLEGAAIAADNIAEYADQATMLADVSGQRDYGFYQDGSIVRNYVWDRDTDEWRAADAPPRYIANVFAPAADGSVNPPVVDTNGDPIRPGGIVEVTQAGVWDGMNLNQGDSLEAIALNPSAATYAGNWTHNRAPIDVGILSDSVPASPEYTVGKLQSFEELDKWGASRRRRRIFNTNGPVFDFTALGYTDRTAVFVRNISTSDGINVVYGAGGVNTLEITQANGNTMVTPGLDSFNVQPSEIAVIEKDGTTVYVSIFPGERVTVFGTYALANAAGPTPHDGIVIIRGTGQMFARLTGVNSVVFPADGQPNADWFEIGRLDISTDIDFTVDPTFLTDRATIDAYVSALRGLQVGSSGTYATLPATRADASPLQSVSPPDVAWLTADDIGTGDAVNPQYPKGLYFWDGTDWQLSLTFEDPSLLTQLEVEDPASTAIGTVSGERLAQAIDARLEVQFPGDTNPPIINFENDYWLDETVGAFPTPVLGKEFAVGIIQANSTDAQAVKDAAKVLVSHYRGVDKGAGIAWAETIAALPHDHEVLENVAVHVRSAGTNAGSSVDIELLLDGVWNPTEWVVSTAPGGLTAHAGPTVLNLDKAPITGPINIGHNKDGYLFFEYIGDATEAELTGVNYVGANNANSDGEIIVNFAGTNQTATFADKASVTPTALEFEQPEAVSQLEIVRYTADGAIQDKDHRAIFETGAVNMTLAASTENRLIQMVSEGPATVITANGAEEFTGSGGTSTDQKLTINETFRWATIIGRTAGGWSQYVGQVGIPAGVDESTPTKFKAGTRLVQNGIDAASGVTFPEAFKVGTIPTIKILAERTGDNINVTLQTVTNTGFTSWVVRNESDVGIGAPKIHWEATGEVA